jgi:hypothetical protein
VGFDRYRYFRLRRFAVPRCWSGGDSNCRFSLRSLYFGECSSRTRFQRGELQKRIEKLLRRFTVPKTRGFRTPSCEQKHAASLTPRGLAIADAGTGQRKALGPRKARPKRVAPGQGLLQVAISDDARIQLSILAKRRRMPLSQVVKSALNLWLETHSYTLRVTD